MSHEPADSYHSLQKRLDDAAQGAPASDTLFKILEVLFTEEEAEFASVLPLTFFSVSRAARLWKKTEKEASNILNNLADKGVLLDMDDGSQHQYLLAPTMAGFIEFSIMRNDGRFDRRVLSELYHQYLNVEGEFVERIFGLDPPIERVFIQEETIPPENRVEVLDYELATHAIKTASIITLGTCYCRQKMEQIGQACDNPQDTCLTLNNAAKSLARHGISQEISKEKALYVLDRSIELGLAQIGGNVQENVNWICNCCSCCCEALLAYKKLGCIAKIHSNFLATVTEECTKCGICVKRCCIEAVHFIKDKNDEKRVQVDENTCIGCGICANFCPNKSMIMRRRDELNFVPLDNIERIVLSAIDAGKLQNYIFDNYTHWTYRALRSVLRVLLELTPVKRTLANQQLRSRYINAAIKAHAILNHEKTVPDYSHPELNKKPSPPTS